MEKNRLNLPGDNIQLVYSNSIDGNMSKLSPNGSNSSFCRICHDGDCTESLLSPCNCTGTLARVHGSCLEHWLSSSNTDKCEICKHQFQTTREPRTYFEYVQDSSNQFNVRNMVADVICFILLTPLLIVSTYLCILGAQQYFFNERWEAIGLIILALFLLSVYYTWCHVTLRYHLSVWKTWRETNQRVRLVDLLSVTKIDSEISHPNRITSVTNTFNNNNISFTNSHNEIASTNTSSYTLQRIPANLVIQEQGVILGNDLNRIV